MRLVRWLRDRLGHALTAAAAVLVVGGMALPAFWPGLFGLPRSPGPLTLAAVLLGVSLIDRFRPTRWFLLWALPVAWILPPYFSASAYHAMHMFQAACATGAWALLLSGPVKAHFRRGGGWLERFYREHGLYGARVADDELAEGDGPPPALPRESWAAGPPASPPGDVATAGTRTPADTRRTPAPEPPRGWWSEP